MHVVQVGFLTAAGEARRSDPNRERVIEYSGTGVYIHMDEAVRAAGLIPDNMSADQAADDFCALFVKPENQGDKPFWFMRRGNEKHDYSIVSKREQFLWSVQSAILANAEKQASDIPKNKHGKSDHKSAMKSMAEAIRVSTLIPDRLEAGEAASEFLGFYARGMDETKSPPKWCVG